MSAVIKKAKGGKGQSASSRGAPAMPTALPQGMWERISRKAYELWVQRGRQEGNALRDWLDAEEAVKQEIHEARQ